MKKIYTLIALTFLFAGLHAQSSGVAPLGKGEKQLNFGTGFTSGGVPLYVSLDIAVHKDVTVTPQVHLKFDNNTTGGILVKGDYHWNALIGIPSNWDFYAGARLGVDFGGGGSDLNLGLEVGGRWYWSEKWGLNLEFGGGTGYGTQLGVSMKL